LELDHRDSLVARAQEKHRIKELEEQEAEEEHDEQVEEVMERMHHRHHEELIEKTRKESELPTTKLGADLLAEQCKRHMHPAHLPNE
jgi:hypothetical protein